MTSISSLREWCKTVVVPFLKEHPVITAAAGVSILLGGLVWLGGSIILTGVISGILVSATIGILVYKVKTLDHPIAKRAYARMVKHSFVTDVVITGLGFLLSPSGITAYVAAGVCGLISSAWLFAEGGAPKQIEEIQNADA